MTQARTPAMKPLPPARLLAATLAATLLAAACTDATSVAAPRDLTPSAPLASQGKATVTNVDYDSKTAAEYGQKWANIYGPLELAAGGTLDVARSGEVTVSAVPFHVGADFSVFDHLKYIAVSTQSFAVPTTGSLEISVDITATTPGTVAGRVIHGCYGAPYSYQHVGDPCAHPWTSTAVQGQQAGVVLNMINFATGQLFDWFVSDDEVFALVERLPSNVTGNPGVGLDKAYTQIIKVAPISRRKKHRVSIRYTRGLGVSNVEFSIDGKSFATVDHVGIPLDKQGVPYTGTYPSYGPGEALGAGLDSFVIGHGLFSLLDAFPFQHPDRPDLSVSVPMSERLFGQGAVGSFKNFRVTTTQ